MSRKFYFCAFFTLPAVMLLLTLANRILPLDFPVALVGLLVACVFTGFQAPRRPDWLLAALFPLSVFATVYLANLLSEGECTAAFDFAHALKQSTRTEFLIQYLCLGAAGFAASFRKR